LNYTPHRVLRKTPLDGTIARFHIQGGERRNRMVKPDGTNRLPNRSQRRFKHSRNERGFRRAGENELEFQFLTLSGKPIIMAVAFAHVCIANNIALFPNKHASALE
jgi:hypothetical protein